MHRNIHGYVVARYLGEVWNRGRIELLDELVHAEYVGHQSGRPVPCVGACALARVVRAARVAFPDLRFEILDQIQDADRVVVRCSKRAKYAEASDACIDIEQMLLFRFQEGKIIEQWSTVLFSSYDNELAFTRMVEWMLEPHELEFRTAAQAARSGAESAVRIPFLPHVRACIRESFDGANERDETRAPEMKDVARRIGMSPRTLQRRLQQVGTTFKQEVDGIRQELACEYLAKTARPLKEIALQLGFFEATSFFRSFRRWTRMSPLQFRLRAGGVDSAFTSA
ncbi:helix-turn-helix domain-containing protein [Pendulispora brunnea]|uniref:Helix-turn-helix domain-containing protein n=1 Tax=Pendulispora brunnea TaxID=2905690 RepID=A0ABZ2JVJ5_9BACT